jgi:hypothetical protein
LAGGYPKRTLGVGGFTDIIVIVVFPAYSRSGREQDSLTRICLKVHKIENFFDSDFGIGVISLIVMSKY